MNDPKIPAASGPPSEIERVKLMRFRESAELVFNYFAIVYERNGEKITCAIVRREAKDSPFPMALGKVISYLHLELFSKHKITEIGWVEVRFGLNLSHTLLHAVRTGRCESAASTVVWAEADLRTHEYWVERTRVATDVLLRIGG